jgi:chromosome condensin MukBEF MukE localization factor
LYRRGILSEDELYDELRKLGIADEVANAIVENEAAKKGVVWTK